MSFTKLVKVNDARWNPIYCFAAWTFSVPLRFFWYLVWISVCVMLLCSIFGLHSNLLLCDDVKIMECDEFS